MQFVIHPPHTYEFVVTRSELSVVNKNEIFIVGIVEIALDGFRLGTAATIGQPDIRVVIEP